MPTPHCDILLQAASMFLESIATFTAVELFDYPRFIKCCTPLPQPFPPSQLVHITDARALTSVDAGTPLPPPS